MIRTQNPAGPARLIVSTDGASARPAPATLGGDGVIGWSSDGRALLVQRGAFTADTRIDRVDVATGAVVPWRTSLGPEDRTGDIVVAPAHVAADGEAHAYTYVRRLSDLFLLTQLARRP